MKKTLFGSLNRFTSFHSLIVCVQKLISPRLYLVTITVLFSLIFLQQSPQIKAQIIIEEKIEITQVKPSSGCVWGGCAYDLCDSTELTIIFDPPQISSGGTTTFTLWYESSGGLNQYFENGEILQTNINIEPAYGQWTRISGGVYRITIPDTVTADSVSIIVSYENYSVFCWAKMNDGSVANPEFTDCIVCPIWSGSGLIRNYGSAELIIKPDSFVVTLDPPEVYPGDTVQVKIQKRNADGTLADFPPEQTFEIAKLDGCMLGNILAEGNSGAYFYDVTQPIYFAAADSIDGDTTQTVLLRVGLIENDKSKTIVAQNFIGTNECFIGNFSLSTYQDKSFTLGPRLELITYANGEPNKWINGYDPAMPEFPIQIEITNDTRGNFEFLRYYLFLEWKNTQQTGDPVYGGGVTKLLHLPSGGSPVMIDFDIDWDYPNPGFICGGDELTLRIEYKGVKKNFKLNTDVLGNNPDKQIIKEYIANSELFPEIDLPLSEIVTEADQILQIQIIVLKESTWKQFKSTGDRIGYPNVNPKPHDWGLCQLSKPDPTIKEIWNWQENLNSGINFLWGTDPKIHKYAQVKNKFKSLKQENIKDGKVPRDPNREEFLKMLSQRYKGGYYYIGYVQGKKDKDGFYAKSSVVGYGNDFWTKFKDVEDGPPYPAGW